MAEQEAKLKAIADAIREKEGSTGAIPANTFADRIRAIPVGANTNDATATSADILSGKTAYAGGKKITGTIGTEIGGYNIDPGPTTRLAVSDNTYVEHKIYVSGDENLVPGNIKSGVSIFGVAGSYSGIPIQITATTSPGATVTATLGSTVLTQVANSDGVAVFNVPISGNWILSASLYELSSKSVSVPVAQSYSASIPVGGTSTVSVIQNYSVGLPLYTSGVDWSLSSLPTSAKWQSICYGNGKFVAIAYYEKYVAYSTDGVTWKQANLPSSRPWISVCYGNGKFVMISGHSSSNTTTKYLAYSSDGITWTESTMPTARWWSAVSYCNNKFIATARGSSKAAYSTNGITWTEVDMPVSAYWSKVAYGNGMYVCVASHQISSGTKYVAYSTDGITWKRATDVLPYDRVWTSVCYGNGKFVAIAHEVSINEISIAYSTNGTKWISASVPKSIIESNLTDVCYGDGKFIAVTGGYNNKSVQSKNNLAAYSEDGITWTAVTLPASDWWGSIAYGNGKFLVISGYRGPSAVNQSNTTNSSNVLCTPPSIS